MTNKARKQSGFTLLELLIVIVIIGILALLILPNLTSAPKKARDTKRKTDIVAIEKGLEEYLLNNNSYPDSVTAGLAALTGGTAPIMKTIPTDPKNVAPYVYTYVTANGDTTYTLSACLENSNDSGTDVVLPAVSNNTACTTKVFQVVNG
jgi:type II secretion system protein G